MLFSAIRKRLNDFNSFQISPFKFLPQAQHIETDKLAAAKICELKGEDELEDFTVEIDILSECRHKNIVQLYEAFFYEGKLWVSMFTEHLGFLTF